MAPESTNPGCVSIGDGVKLTGKIDLPGTANIDGQVEGEIAAKELRVGSSGRIVGSVIAVHADIHGEIDKDLTVTDTLILRSTSKVRGTIVYEVIEIEQGATVEGSFKRVSADKRAKSAPGRPMGAMLATPPAEPPTPPAADAATES